eukprot:13993094-Heterocapsa_arctica.AAC.1
MARREAGAQDGVEQLAEVLFMRHAVLVDDIVLDPLDRVQVGCVEFRLEASRSCGSRQFGGRALGQQA